jgi:hypothetical protein
MFLKKEAKKRNFKRKEEKEEKEAEWDARILFMIFSTHFILFICFSIQGLRQKNI